MIIHLRYLALLFLMLLYLANPISAQPSQADLERWLTSADEAVNQIDDDDLQEESLGYLIAVQFRMGQDDDVKARFEELVDEIADEYIDGRGAEWSEKFHEKAQRLQQLARTQASQGNFELALKATSKIESALFRKLSYMDLIRAAGNRNNQQVAEQIFDQANNDEFFETNQIRAAHFIPLMSDTLLQAQIECGDPESALDTLTKHKDEPRRGIGTGTEIRVSVAKALQDKGLIEQANTLAEQTIKEITDRGNGLHFQSEYVSAHMCLASLQPEKLDQLIANCVDVLENYQGTNGPGTAYWKLAHQLAIMGEFDKALEFTEKLDQPTHRGHVLQRIAVLMARDENLMEAKQVIDSIVPESIKLETTSDIASVLIELKNTSAARQFIDEVLPAALEKLEDDETTTWSLELLTRLAGMQVQIGDHEAAFDWAMDLDKPHHKATVLLAMVGQGLNDQE